MSRAKLIELSRRALEGDEAAVASLRTEDVDVPDQDLLRRAKNRINRIEQEAMRVPFEKPKAGFKFQNLIEKRLGAVKAHRCTEKVFI
jgi:hypothetical protein